MTLFFNQQITRHRAPVVTDAHGNQVRDWSAATTTSIDGVNVQPNAQNEDADALRDSVVTSWRIQSAPDTDLDIVATDRITYDGIPCEVIGEVARWPNQITGAVHHVEVTIQRTEG